MLSGTWTDKYASERFPNTVDWSAELGAAQIVTCSAEAVEGGVRVDDPVASLFDGPVQTVWVSGGQTGPASVRCSITVDDGRVLSLIAHFKVK